VKVELVEINAAVRGGVPAEKYAVGDSPKRSGPHISMGPAKIKNGEGFLKPSRNCCSFRHN
jgi:hypothetical protein